MSMIELAMDANAQEEKLMSPYFKGGVHNNSCPHLITNGVIGVCLILQTAIFLVLGCGGFLLWRSQVAQSEWLHKEYKRLDSADNHLFRTQNKWLVEENEQLRATLIKLQQHPYEALTASAGHEQPKMYGAVKEKTIWSYWHHPKQCPSSTNCVLPAAIQLCADTIEMNKGTFDFKIIHINEVEDYISMIELPFHWRELSPQNQKDALMNALLARYGGVALDISSILLRPLDDYWDEMVARRATFRGYMYRINGLPWRHPEVSAVWFLMSRREGIFSAAVRHQVIGMGDKKNTDKYHVGYFALGDQTLLPLLTMFNYSLPKCFEDDTVTHFGTNKPMKFACPEHEEPPWFKGVTGPARNDGSIMLRDPRDGPQLPFACLRMAVWDVTNTDPLNSSWPVSTFGDWARAEIPGAPMYKVNCRSMKDCWENVFMRRYNEPATSGEARLLHFVKMFSAGEADLKDRSRTGILANKNTYFYQWLKLAGLPQLNDELND